MCANPQPSRFLKAPHCAGSRACAGYTICICRPFDTKLCLVHWLSRPPIQLALTQSLSFNCCCCAWSSLSACHLTRDLSLSVKVPQLCVVQHVHAMKSVYADPSLAVAKRQRQQLDIAVYKQQCHWMQPDVLLVQLWTCGSVRIYSHLVLNEKWDRSNQEGYGANTQTDRNKPRPECRVRLPTDLCGGSLTLAPNQDKL